MMEQKRLDCGSVIIKQGDKILMHRRGPGKAEGFLDLIGGKSEEGETPEQTAIRETFEETSCHVRLLEKIESFDSDINGPETLHVYWAEIVSGEITPSEEGNPEWVSPYELKDEDFAFAHTRDFIRRIYPLDKSRE